MQGQKDFKKNKQTNNDSQNTTQKIKVLTELLFCKKVSSFCSTSSTRRAKTLTMNHIRSLFVNEERRNGL
jgi:hypothetical protein